MMEEISSNMANRVDLGLWDRRFMPVGEAQAA